MDANKYFQILHMISAGGQKVCRKFLIGKGFSEAMIDACAENGYIIQIGTDAQKDAERAGAEPEGLRQGLLHGLSRLYLCQPDGQAHPPQLSEPAFPGVPHGARHEAHPLPRPAS